MRRLMCIKRVWGKTAKPNHEKRVLSYVIIKDTDQPVHLRSLISAFVVHYLKDIKQTDSISKISRL